MGNSEESKTVPLVHCPECSGHHRINIKLTTYGIGPVEPPPEALPDKFLNKLFRSELQCPKTKRSFTPDDDDWLHLTEDEFHRRFPGRRS